jgi:hypothetical protein
VRHFYFGWWGEGGRQSIVLLEGSELRPLSLLIRRYEIGVNIIKSSGFEVTIAEFLFTGVKVYNLEKK